LPETGHSHYWRLKKEEPLISRGECECGAVRYFPNDTDKKILKRAEELNQKYGKEGTVAEITSDKSSAIKSDIPLRPASRYKMKRYYDKNKDAILKDLEHLGLKEMCRRWGISQSTWCTTQKGKKVGLAVRWGVALPETKQAKRETKASKSESHKSPSDTKVNKGDRLVSLGIFRVEVASELPDFPPFDSSWSTLTQIEWLQTYRELARK